MNMNEDIWLPPAAEDLTGGLNDHAQKKFSDTTSEEVAKSASQANAQECLNQWMALVQRHVRDMAAELPVYLDRTDEDQSEAARTKAGDNYNKARNSLIELLRMNTEPLGFQVQKIKPIHNVLDSTKIEEFELVAALSGGPLASRTLSSSPPTY